MMIFDKTPQQKMNIEKRILNMHPYVITAPKTDSDRWQTYVKKEGEKRKILRAPSYDQLMEKLFEFYFCGISFSDMTFK